MQYLEIRDTIKSGDLLAFSHKEWRTWRDWKIQFVRMITQSEYSHVGIAVVMCGRIWVVEAVIPCVRIYPLSLLGDFYLIPTNEVWTIEAEEYALARIGEKYSQWQAIKAFFGKLKTDSKWECAELAIAIGQKFGWDLGTQATPTHVISTALHTSSLTYVQNPPK